MKVTPTSFALRRNGKEENGKPTPRGRDSGLHRPQFPCGIAVLDRSGRSGPIMFCHRCGERIKDYRVAMVSWRSGDPGFGMRLWHNDIPQCLPMNEVPSMEMRDFFVYLAANVGFRTGKELKDAFEWVFENEFNA